MRDHLNDAMIKAAKELAGRREAALLGTLTGGASTAGSSAESTLDADSMRKAMEDLGPVHRRPQFDFMNPLGVNGMRVFEEPLPPPKLKLSAHIQVSDEFRKKYDAWLLAEFGRKEPVLKRSRYMVSESMGVIIAPHGGAALLASVCA